jgi:hypothetical protein
VSKKTPSSIRSDHELPLTERYHRSFDHALFRFIWPSEAIFLFPLPIPQEDSRVHIRLCEVVRERTHGQFLGALRVPSHLPERMLEYNGCDQINSGWQRGGRVRQERINLNDIRDRVYRENITVLSKAFGRL